MVRLPVADGSFDAVLSTFGVMFTPEQETAAKEFARVCVPGGKMGRERRPHQKDAPRLR